MRVRRVFLAFLISAVLMLLVAGCGSNNTASNQPPSSQPPGTQPPPTQPPPPPTPPPPTPPPPTPPPPSPPPTPSFAFQVTLTSATQQTAAPAGELDINTDGNSRINFTGATPNAQYTLTFCPFPAGSAPCQQIAALNSDSSGTVSTSFQIFQKGTYFGAWDVDDQSGTAVFVQSWDYGRVGDKLQSNVYRVADLTSGNPIPGIGGEPGSDPLTSGTVTVTGGGDANNFPLHVVLNGALASATYRASACTIGGSSGCYDVGPLSTDAQGNVDTTLNLWAQGFDVIIFNRPTNDAVFEEFVAAVQVQ